MTLGILKLVATFSIPQVLKLNNRVGITAGGKDNPVTQFAGGVLATLVQSSVMVPTEVVRQRQQIQTTGEGSYTVLTHRMFLSSTFFWFFSFWTNNYMQCCGGPV